MPIFNSLLLSTPIILISLVIAIQTAFRAVCLFYLLQRYLKGTGILAESRVMEFHH